MAEIRQLFLNDTHRMCMCIEKIQQMKTRWKDYSPMPRRRSLSEIDARWLSIADWTLASCSPSTGCTDLPTGHCGLGFSWKWKRSVSVSTALKISRRVISDGSRASEAPPIPASTLTMPAFFSFPKVFLRRASGYCCHRHDGYGWRVTVLPDC